MGIRTAASLLAILLLPSLAQAAESKTTREGMAYSIQVPKSYAPSEGAVLVLGLHGRGGSNTQFMPILVGASYLKQHILVAPNALTNARWGAEDLPVLAALVRELHATFNVSRTIAFGFSQGAYCSFGFSLNYPELVEAAIPHSGGIGFAGRPTDAAKDVAFYVIHGDADTTVPVEQSRSATKHVESLGITHVKYEEIAGLGHTISRAACERGFAWVEKTLGPARTPLSPAEAKRRLGAVDKAIKSEDWETAREELKSLSHAGARYAKKIGGVAKRCIKAADEGLALVAIDVAGRLGQAGLSALKAVPDDNEVLSAAAATALARTRSLKALKPLLSYLKGSSDAVALSAVNAVERIGDSNADQVLLSGLKAAEKSSRQSARGEAILAALTRLHGQTLDSSKAWARWLAQAPR
jgi:predicted esterase